MKLQHPQAFAQIPVSQHAYAQLLGGAVVSPGEKEEWQIAEEAIEEWTCRHNPEGLTESANSGYQWKALFLPHGTLLRTAFKCKNHHCVVEGEAILYDGRAFSPSGFVNAVGGMRRNAWKCLWIRLPNSGEWKLAETLRSRQRPRPARPAPEALNLASPTTSPTTSTPPTTPMTSIKPGTPLAAPANSQQCQCACAVCGVPQPQRPVKGDSPVAFPNVMTLPLRGVQRMGHFRRHQSRIAGASPERRPNSIQDVADALRRAEAQRPAAWPNQDQKPERLFIAWFSRDDGFAMPTAGLPMPSAAWT
ncbi:MAG: hypothetical protein V4857_09890 [Pseudomonadota bacterium]